MHVGAEEWGWDERREQRGETTEEGGEVGSGYATAWRGCISVSMPTEGPAGGRGERKAGEPKKNRPCRDAHTNKVDVGGKCERFSEIARDAIDPVCLLACCCCC